MQDLRLASGFAFGSGRAQVVKQGTGAGCSESFAKPENFTPKSCEMLKAGPLEHLLDGSRVSGKGDSHLETCSCRKRVAGSQMQMQTGHTLTNKPENVLPGISAGRQKSHGQLAICEW